MGHAPEKGVRSENAPKTCFTWLCLGPVIHATPGGNAMQMFFLATRAHWEIHRLDSSPPKNDRGERRGRREISMRIPLRPLRTPRFLAAEGTDRASSDSYAV